MTEETEVTSATSATCCEACGVDLGAYKLTAKAPDGHLLWHCCVNCLVQWLAKQGAPITVTPDA